MVEAWSTRAGLYAMFAAAAIVTAGCSPLATLPEEDQQDEVETLEAVELDPAVTKLDEANIIDTVQHADAVNFDLTPKGQIDLAKANVNGRIITAMKQRARQ